MSSSTFHPNTTSFSQNPAAADFDYVMVGAGSAGCVVADQLCASGRYSVLLIGAGGSDRRVGGLLEAKEIVRGRGSIGPDCPSSFLILEPIGTFDGHYGPF